MVQENKPKRSLSIFLKLFIFIFIGFTLLISLCSCFNENNNSSLDDGKAICDQIIDLYNNTGISQEEKATQAKDLIIELTPKIEELEKQKDEESSKKGKTYQLWQGFLNMNNALNAIINNDSENFQKNIEVAQESLSRAEKEPD